MFQDAQDMKASLLAHGLSEESANKIVSFARPALLLETSALNDEASLPRGVTRIGGRPDMPRAMEWPVRPAYSDAAERWTVYQGAIDRTLRDMRQVPPPPFAMDASRFAEWERRLRAQQQARERAEPLDFIAQVNFADIPHDSGIDLDVPRIGRLLFFYDAAEQPWGGKAADILGARVIYDLSDPTELVLRDPPQGRRPAPAARCANRLVLTAPPEDYVEIEKALEGQTGTYFEWYIENGPGRPGRTSDHRVGGHPSQVQSDMRKDNPFYGSSSDQLLVLQISNDDATNMMWGGSGYLYVWIDRRDLHANRWDRAHVILQTS